LARPLAEGLDAIGELVDDPRRLALVEALASAEDAAELYVTVIEKARWRHHRSGSHA
jgi:hypothetical protein